MESVEHGPHGRINCYSPAVITRAPSRRCSNPPRSATPHGCGVAPSVDPVLFENQAAQPGAEVTGRGDATAGGGAPLVSSQPLSPSPKPALATTPLRPERSARRPSLSPGKSALSQ